MLYVVLILILCINFQQKRQMRLYENVTVVKTRSSLHDCDLKAFHNMIKSIRSKIKHFAIFMYVLISISPLSIY
jgi:hypothetical protein